VSPLTSLFKHAITPLAFDRSKIHRERLVDRIHASLLRKLIVIIAPPGYGKSILLADFTAHTELPVCWVRLSEADQDVMRLASVLAASLQKRFRRLRGQPDLEAMSSSSPEALARVFVELIEARIGESFVIALDDVQLVNPSQPAMIFLDTLLTEQPSHMTLLIAGRELPELSLAELVVDGDMTGISLHELALTRDELITLAQHMVGKELEESDVDRLLEETQGWISGVLLSATLLRSSAGALAQRTRPMVYEYLASVVFARQPDDLCRFMLESSVLPIMTAAGCDHVLQQEDSQRYLTHLVRMGLFVTATDQSPRTYEYHPLFRQFLNDMLGSRDLRLLRSLRSRAAAHLASHGSPEDAVELYFQVGATKRAAALVEKHAPQMYEMGRTQTLETWAKRLEDTGASAPGTYLYLAAIYTDKGDLNAADIALQRAFEMLEAGKPNKIMLARAWNIKGSIALQRGRYPEVLQAVEEAERLLSRRSSQLRRATCLRLRARAIFGSGGDIQEAERLATRAINLLEQTDDQYTLAQVLFDLTLIQNALGKPLEVQATSLRAHEILERIGAPLSLAISFNTRAVSAHLEGRYDQAFQLFTEGLKFAHRAASQMYQAWIIYGQADLFCDLGLHYQAAELYGQGLRLATRLDHLELMRYGFAQTGALHRRCKTGRLPLEWLERATNLDRHGDTPVAVEIQLAAVIIESSPLEAERRLTELLQHQEAELHAHDRALILYFLARAVFTKNYGDEAKTYLEEALNWAGGRGVEQYLAGEMMYDDEFHKFAESSLPDHPVLSVITQRVELMRTVARNYQATPHEESETAQLRLLALGSSDIYKGATRVSNLEPLPRQLLFYLANHRQTERDELLETFWRDVPVGRQVSSLYTTMHGIRRAINGGIIQIDGSLYSLTPDYPIKYDVAEFERVAHVAESMPPGDPRRFFALTEAINVYSGSFLPEYATDWVLEQRRVLENRLMKLLTLHVEEALARGQTLQAVNSLRMALKIDPLRDDINLRYLELLGQLDRRSEAISHYQRYVRLLADELGLDPPEPVRELYTRLIS